MQGLAKFVLIAAAAICLNVGIAGAQERTFEAVPMFESCGDGSYDRAVNDGITLGIAPIPVYSNIDPTTKKAMGLDVEINEAVLNWLHITKINYRDHTGASLEAHRRHRQQHSLHPCANQGSVLHRTRVVVRTSNHRSQGESGRHHIVRRPQG